MIANHDSGKVVHETVTDGSVYFGWMPSIPQFADSLSDGGKTQLMQRWWTGVTPMEAQLYPNGVPQPGLVPPSEALPALKLRETSCYSGTYGLYVEGGPGCDPGTYTGHTQQAYTLNTGVMAVALGNYGLLGPGQQQRYTDDLATLQVGATLPAGATVHQVTLNGSAAHYSVRDTNAGREVLVSTPCRGQTWRVHVVGG
jgi:hypothetical protein